MLDIDARETPSPQIDSKESRDPIHTVLLNRRAFLKIPPTPYIFCTTTLLLSFVPTPPGAKIKGSPKKIFAKI
jgi:hypothetical protein